MPVNTINPPYPVPYARVALPCHGLELRRASLSGPEATAPMPLPADKIPSKVPTSVVSSRPFTALTMPEMVVTNPPANKPYKMLNTISRGRASENPQNKKTESTAPTVLMITTVVTWKRSISIPSKIVLGTDDAFTRATRSVPIDGP